MVYPAHWQRPRRGLAALAPGSQEEQQGLRPLALLAEVARQLELPGRREQHALCRGLDRQMGCFQYQQQEEESHLSLAVGCC